MTKTEYHSRVKAAIGRWQRSQRGREQHEPARRDMAERALQDNILSLCKFMELLAYHTHDSRHSAPGFPDLVIVGRRILYRELKTEKGRITSAQQMWLDRLVEAGGDAKVWRPMQWTNGTVERELAAIR